jgi:two-component system LytT family sensor kinase
MSKKRITYIHIFIWLFAVFANLPYSNLGADMPARQIVLNIIAFLYLMVVFYLFYLILVPAFLNRKKIAAFFGYSFLIVLLMPFFGYTFLFFVRALFDGTFNNFYGGYTFRMHMSGYYPVLTAAVFGSFFRVIINWFTTMNQKTELDKQKLAVELDLLKSKLNPHFLFNTLNNIDSLIHKNSEEASAALIRLSEMMRYMTYETLNDVVKLEKEAGYIRNFIELQRIRIKSPEDIRFEFQGDPDVMISPAIFLPLIENSFKFASFRNGKPGVNIHLLSQNKIVILEITNMYEINYDNSKNGHSGSGIINLKKRLDLTYPGKYKLITDQSNGQYHVKLIIDTNEDQLYSY